MDVRRGLIYVAAVVTILFAIVLAVTGRFGQSGALTCGSVVISATDSAACVTVTTATDGAASTHYDSGQFPLGTNYAVPAGKTLYVTGILTTASATSAIVLEWTPHRPWQW